jgi:tetratricopeptide (TPR) repeat protein
MVPAALDFYSAADQATGQAVALNAVGWFHVLLGEPEQALNYCCRPLDLHRDLADRHLEAPALDSVGFAHHHLGDHDQAVTC